MRPIPTIKTPKILLVRPDALGDVILMLPTVMALRQQWPESTIVVLGNDYTAPLLEAHPAIDEVWLDPFEKGTSVRGLLTFVKTLKSAHFDFVIHAFNEAPYVLATWLAKIPVRVGDSRKLLLSGFHTHRVRQDFDNPLMHEVDLDLQLLKPFNFTLPTVGQFGWEGVDFPQPLSPQRVPYVVIHPGVGRGNRSIPSGIYKGLIRCLSHQGMTTVLTGGQNERTQNASIAAGDESVVDMTGQTDLLQLAGLIQGASIMISVDTGPMHLAASLGTHVLNLSPSKYVKPTRWGPYRVHHRVVRPETICSYRCFPNGCKRGDCTEAFDPKIICQALDDLVNIPADKERPNMDNVKARWIQLSMPVLDLRRGLRPIEAEGYRYFQRSNVSGFFWRWVVVQDIGFFLVDRRLFWHPLVEKILALWLYYPPRFVVNLP